MKFNWGHGIAIFLVIFVVTTVSVVVKISTDETYDNELVSEDYYGDELKYQEEIDKSENAKKLSASITYRVSKEGVTLIFPHDFDFQKITGVIDMKRPSKQILDFKMNVKIDSTYQMLIPSEKAIQGKWNMVIDWKVGENEFMYKAKIRL
jgi:nitrogen fixation protein FixH